MKNSKMPVSGRSKLILPLAAAAGHPASLHYQDGLAGWQNGRYHSMLFTRDRIKKAAESITLFEPATAYETGGTSDLA